MTKLTYHDEVSFALHAAIKRELLRHPDQVLLIAKQNLTRWRDSYETTPSWMSVWYQILEQGVSAVEKVLDGLDDASVLLRSNTPFTGILTQMEQDEIRTRVKSEATVTRWHQAERYTDLSIMDQQRVATAALNAFFKITECWGLTGEQQRKLLGDLVESAFMEWNSTKNAKQLDPSTLTRISHVIGIYHALHTIYSDQELADGWLGRPNDNPLFGGDPAMVRLVTGEEEDLRLIHQHLLNRIEGGMNMSDKPEYDIPDDVFIAAVELFEGNESDAMDWLNRELKAIGWERPTDILQTKQGRERVINIIGIIENGIIT